MTLRPCIDCGEPVRDTRCPEHAASYRPQPKASAHSRGYDIIWTRLSKRARKLQPFCSDCGTTDDLTCDHSEQAWLRKAEGKVIRLVDIDVVCRSCNAKRGARRVA